MASINDAKREKIHKILNEHTITKTENKLYKLKTEHERQSMMTPVNYAADKLRTRSDSMSINIEKQSIFNINFKTEEVKPIA